MGAFKRGHRETSKEFIDEEFSYRLLERILRSNYQDTEAVKLLSYLAKFNNEFHKNVIKKGDLTALHNTEALRKECYARENARNRDIMSNGRYFKIYMEEFDNIKDDDCSLQILIDLL